VPVETGNGRTFLTTRRAKITPEQAGLPAYGLAFALAAVLVLGDLLGWRIVSAMFDRERLITATR
jgi:hypothetical protein